jgi:hypothetical protein
MAKAFSELSEREILALAISLEEEDARICGDRTVKPLTGVRGVRATIVASTGTIYHDGARKRPISLWW